MEETPFTLRVKMQIPINLTDGLPRIPQATNPTVAELLPWNWEPAKG